MLLLIDNYDSFTYNLYQYFRELACEVVVCRNDSVTLTDIERLAPTHLVISPGPGAPQTAGISLAAISHFSDRLPILGVCLGHQALGEAFGAEIRPARQVMHGKTSIISHHNSGLFQGLNNPLTVTRYHSLILHPPRCRLALTSPLGMNSLARRMKLWESPIGRYRCLAYNSILRVF